jgi:hypothetical protein
MILSPLKVKPARPVALLLPGWRSLHVETEWGSQIFRGTDKIRRALEKLADFSCYVVRGVESMNQSTPAREWTLTTWRGTPSSILHVPSGCRITSLRSTLEDSLDPYADLLEVMKWLRGYGVSPASVSSMSWQLFRASLSRKISIGADPEISRPAFFGGRQEIQRPAIYTDLIAWDIKAAYPSAMAARPFALSLREVDPSTELDPTRSGIARAKVFVPADLDYPPLPVRLDDEAIQFQWGDLEGTWTWHELHSAREAGCEIEIERAWAPGREADLFSTWFDMSRTGRDLPGSAATLAKAVSNSLWGQFAMRGVGSSEVRWADDKGIEPYETEIPPQAMPHEWTIHVAAEVTSRVRCQTLYEGIQSPKSHPVHIDTDGIIVPEGATPPLNVGDGFGQWRRKDAMKIADIRAPQVFRYQKPTGPEWYYVASGLSKDQAWKLFEREDVKPSMVGYLARFDVCIPSGWSDDAVLSGIYLNEIERVRVGR